MVTRQYQLVILPPPSGDLSTYAADINNANIVIGHSRFQNQGTDSRSVKWINGVPSQVLPANSGAYAINDSGKVAGHVFGVIFSYGYLFDGAKLEDVRTTTLNTAGDYSLALDVNNSDRRCRTKVMLSRGKTGMDGGAPFLNGVPDASDREESSVVGQELA